MGVVVELVDVGEQVPAGMLGAQLVAQLAVERFVSGTVGEQSPADGGHVDEVFDAIFQDCRYQELAGRVNTAAGQG